MIWLLIGCLALFFVISCCHPLTQCLASNACLARWRKQFWIDMEERTYVLFCVLRATILEVKFVVIGM
jgi:hypothetical protein